MSRTKGKSDPSSTPKKASSNNAPDHHEHVDTSERNWSKASRASRSKLPRGAAERRKGSYGYRTSPRSG